MPQLQRNLNGPSPRQCYIGRKHVYDLDIHTLQCNSPRIYLYVYVYLGGGEVVAVTVSHDLALAPGVVVRDGLPPDRRLGHPELRQLGEDAALALGVQQVDANRRMVALDEVDEVEHPHERHLRGNRKDEWLWGCVCRFFVLLE